uniref:AAA+ ATPase domain-containing protein n=1 Tax=viral metagenome TaxID=1070528 RepID=A0A6C0C187_9ZZZZ
MEQLNINKLLDRENFEKIIINFLNRFEKEKHILTTKRGVYLYGTPGSGKTYFIKSILKKLNYDVITFDAGDVRNKTIVDTITNHNMSDTNVLSLFKKEKRNIAIIMDEIDGMNSGDKGGINALIKLIRPKKTKKQKKEDLAMIPIICIGSNHIDKKIKEMIKNCIAIKLLTPTKSQIKNICSILMDKLDDNILTNIVEYIQGDIRKLKSTYNIYENHPDLLKNSLSNNMFQKKNYNEDTKQITKKLLNSLYNINEHSLLMNETDRTSVGLLFHENIIDVLKNKDYDKSIPFYCKILDNICFSDYIDRITFQKQIWIFNEMSSLIKTFYNNHLYHNEYPNKKKYNPSEVRFTKVLTKYSTEYNNSLFIGKLCQELNMDKNDMFSYFLDLKNKKSLEKITELFNNENYNINKLDINRIYRYLNSYCTIE